MDIVYTITAFIYGVVFGSFLNVVGLRVPNKETLLTRSHCANCNINLTAIDLIPVLSYIILGGKCRTCKVKISPKYLIVEIVTGMLFAFATYSIGIKLELIPVLLFISLLVTIVVSDLAYNIISDKVLMFFLPLIIIGRVLSPLNSWSDSILGAIIGFSIMMLIAIISKGGMGGGDIKLFFVIGIMLGTVDTVLVLFVASLIGSIIGTGIILIKKGDRKTGMPFGPSIAIACLIIYFYGDNLIKWYTNFL